MTGSRSAAGPGTALGFASAAAALLAVLQTALSRFDLRPEIFALLVLLAGLAGWVAARLRLQAARRERDRALDAALACWFPPTIEDVSVFDLGAAPTSRSGPDGRHPYVPRDVDGQMQAALAEPSLVVVSGPALAGKTRSAFEAVHETLKPAVALVPEDAPGLACLLSLDPPLELAGKPAVLWLDGLDQYLDGLEVDALDAWRREQGGRVWVVATVRSERLRELLRGSNGSARALRRFLARSHGVQLDDHWSAGERAAAARLYGGPQGFEGKVGDSFVTDVPPPRPLFRSTAFTCAIPSLQARWFSDLVLVGLLALTLATAAALASIGSSAGWELPDPVAEQLADLRERFAKCGRVDQSPEAVAAVETARRVVFVSRDSDRCLVSDAVRIYRLHEDRLEPQFSFQPQSVADTKYRFVCAGPEPADPCSVDVGGASTLVGEFVDPDHNDAIPVAVDMAANGAARIRAVFERPARAEPRQLPPAARIAAAHERERVLLANTLRGPDAGQPVRGYSVAAATVVVAESLDAPLLVAGLIRRGSFDAPRTLSLRAWRLTVARDGPERKGRCFAYRGTRPMRDVTVDLRRLALDEPSDLQPLRAAWRRTAGNRLIVCG